MPKQVSQKELDAIVEVVGQFPEGATLEDVSDTLNRDIPRRTLQRYLSRLVKDGRISKEGKARASRYKLPRKTTLQIDSAKHEHRSDNVELEQYIPISPEAEEIKAAVRLPIQQREPVGYNSEFLDSYRPNETFYLSEDTRQQLLEMGRSANDVRPAGTYVRQIFNRLLIDKLDC